MTKTRIIGGAGHTVMLAQSVVRFRQLLFLGLIRVRRAEAVSAMFQRHTAQCMQGVLQPFSQGRIALAPLNHVSKAPATEGQSELIDQMSKCLPPDRDS